MTTNWNDLQSVIAYLTAQRWTGMVVFKHPDRANYNITHASRTDRYEPSWVVYRV